MKIGEIEIPDSEIEKLSPSKKRILYCIYEAWRDDGGVPTWTVLRAGGTGFSTRIEKLNKLFLCKYNLIIRNKEYARIEGRCVFLYWIAPIDALPVMPRKVFGDM